VRPPLSLLRCSAVLGIVALLAAAPAAAGPEDDARAAALAFLDASARGDAERVCSLFSPAALSRLGGFDRCRDSMEESDESEDDYRALETLDRAHTAAKLSATKRRGQFVTKKFGPRALARDMEQLDPELSVKLGKGSAAAKDELATTVVLDTRSTARRVVLYAESDDGTIFRLSATRGGRPTYEEVGVGVPETSRPPSEAPTGTSTTTIDSVTIDNAGTAFVRGSFVVAHEEFTFKFGILFVLVRVNGAYLIDDIFYSTLRDDS
jgi:hypothetical protein